MTSIMVLPLANVMGFDSLVIIILILIVIFGPSKLSELGKGLGEGIRNFKSSMGEPPKDSKKDEEQKK
jgi:sec-independent protein translocase protein TatA